MRKDRIVEFVRLIREGIPPKRAERSAAGYLPGRAMRYCDAMTAATGYGYWIFPPMDIRLIWDGEQVFWSYGEDQRWLPLSGTDSRAVQFPNYAEEFDATAPENLGGCSPPFLTALLEPGGLQMWTGLLVQTRPGWSISVRSPVNLSGTPGLATWEGIVETDLWFGPLFTIFRITRTDTPVHIRAQVPILQVQPIPQLAYREEVLGSFAVTDATDMASEDWDRLGRVLLPNPHPTIRQGEYAVMVRKRRMCPFDPGSLTSGPSGIKINDADEDESLS